MSRFADWLLGPARLPERPAVVAVAAPAPVRAAGRVALAPASSSPTSIPWGFGPPLAPFTFPEAPPWFDRDSAMSLPTISRSRDLIVSAVSALPFTLWQLQEAEVPPVERRMPGASWFPRPDPDRTRQWLLAWTADDLIFHERAHWLITARYATTYPSAFRRIGPGQLEPRDNGTVTVTDDWGRRRTYPDRDIVEFCSPIEGLLTNGWRAISIALQLDSAADRFASTEVPAGVLEEQPGGEDLTPEQLTAEAERFAMARLANTTASTNKYLRYREIDVNASAMQLVEGRTYQALELSRLANVPGYLVGAPAGTGMTYLNAAQAKADLIDFGAAPIIGCIEQTLSGPNVTPRGQFVRLDQNAWLRNPFTTSADAERSPNDAELTDPAPTMEVPA